MSQIEINCIGSDAVFTNTPNIFSGGNVDTVKFTFNSEWDSYTTKTAVMYVKPKDTALMVLDSNGVANIPSTMIDQKCKLSIGVIGTNANNDIKTSKILTYIVGKGAVTNDMEVTAPTTDVWLQMLSMVSENNEVVKQMEITIDQNQLRNKANIDMMNVETNALQLRGISCIECGSYDGTGVYGESNKNQLSLTMKPKMLIVYTAKGLIPNATSSTTYKGWLPGSFLWNWSQPSSFVGGEQVYVEAQGNNVFWYSTDTVEKQCNASGTTYYYIAIG